MAVEIRQITDKADLRKFVKFNLKPTKAIRITCLDS